MARCASETCGRWRPELLARSLAGIQIDGRWFCSQECVERMARRLLLDARPHQTVLAPVPPSRLGVLLRHQRAITAEQLAQALDAQRRSRRRLGAELIASGIVDRLAVLRALAAQASVPYLATIETSSVTAGPSGLPRDAVRALGVVPFAEVDSRGRVRVACAAPVPGAALAALRRLTGWIPEPYLVSDDAFAALRDRYGSSADGSRSIEFVRTSTVSEAATRIAAAATTARRTSVTGAHWAPYTWVRVRAEGLVRDVLLDNGEDSCRAASTSH